VVVVSPVVVDGGEKKKARGETGRLIRWEAVRSSEWVKASKIFCLQAGESGGGGGFPVFHRDFP
jgi:hypothetical protein